MYNGAFIDYSDFSGGLVTNRASTNLKDNQASALDNIIIFEQGSGFRSRNGNTAFNSTAMNSGANVQGLGYFRTAAGTEYLLAVAGAKLYKSDSLDGTMDDITSTLTITASANNLWTFQSFNNVVVGFGGPPLNPNAPFVWTGTGNAAALSGTPPSAYGVFQNSNRLFAFRTQADPSRIYWSVLGDQSDWTGTGSGSADIWTDNNDTLTAAAVMNNDTVLLFKESSVHQMVTTTLVSGAFPVFPLFPGIGCAGKHACVVADGYAYFITPKGRMAVTDGNTLIDEQELPNLGAIDDLWADANQSRLAYIQGTRYEGADFDHIIWSLTSSGGSTNDLAYVWDLKNECWLRHTTGHKMNAYIQTQSGVLYGGAYDGKIYLMDASEATYTDASESSTGISSYWTSGWMQPKALEQIIQPRKISLVFDTQTAGQIGVSYGFDFSSNQYSFTLDQSDSGSLWDGVNWDEFDWSGTATTLDNSGHLTGRGNVFQFRIQHNSGNKMKIYRASLSGKIYGQKDPSAR